jgi:putative hydrolase of the HAD superfamily
MAIAAVVFDLDYTLAVPERDRQTLLDEVTAAAGLDDIDREEYLAVHESDRATETRAPIFERLIDEGDPEAAASAYRDAVNDALVPVPGAEALLRDLRTQYRLGLLTDGPVRAQQSKLEALGWTDLFDATVITGSLPAGKPDGRAFEEIVSQLGVPASATVYVGDNPIADVRGATDAGMVAVQVLSEHYDRAPEAVAYLDRDQLGPQLRQFLAHRTQVA